ncbi:MAG: hypothetical protein ACYTG1_07195 [Planctomycetota bacterium]|jgi:hypothetical protein
MTRLLPTVLVVAAVVAVTACSRSQSPGLADAPPDEGDDMHFSPPPAQMSGVMHSKLAHAHGLLEGLTIGDFEQVESNAAALHGVSLDAEWLVHDTVAYTTFSDEFRRTVTDIAGAAAREDLAGVTTSYARMIEVCVGCHEYLRQHRHEMHFPGRVSRASDGRPEG